MPSLQFNKSVRPSKQVSTKGTRAPQNFLVGMLKAVCFWGGLSVVVVAVVVFFCKEHVSYHSSHVILCSQLLCHFDNSSDSLVYYVICKRYYTLIIYAYNCHIYNLVLLYNCFYCLYGILLWLAFG